MCRELGSCRCCVAKLISTAELNQLQLSRHLLNEIIGGEEEEEDACVSTLLYCNTTTHEIVFLSFFALIEHLCSFFVGLILTLRTKFKCSFDCELVIDWPKYGQSKFIPSSECLIRKSRIRLLNLTCISLSPWFVADVMLYCCWLPCKGGASNEKKSSGLSDTSNFKLGFCFFNRDNDNKSPVSLVVCLMM